MFGAVWFRFFFQAEDGIRDAQESRGLGDVYKRQLVRAAAAKLRAAVKRSRQSSIGTRAQSMHFTAVLLSLIHI